MTFPFIENLHRLCEHRAAAFQLLTLGIDGFLVRCLIFEPVHPFAFALGTHRGVEAMIRRRQAAVHVDHFILGDTQLRGDGFYLLRCHVSFVNGLNLAFDFAKIEEQFFLRRRCSHFHEGPCPQDIFLNGRANPPHGISGEAETFFGFESLDRLHHSDIAFRDQLGNRQAITAIAHSDLRDQP